MEHPSAVRPAASGPQPTRRAGRSEYGVVGLLAGLGLLVLVEAREITDAIGAGRTLSPRVAPYFVAGFLLVVAALLALDIARGGGGEQEEGEDVDLTHGTRWATLLGLAGLVAGAGQLIPLVGFPAAGALLFFGTARLLGSRNLVVDVVVSLALPLAAFWVFTGALGIYLPLAGA